MTGRSRAPVAADRQRSRVYDAEHLVHRMLDRAAQFPLVEVGGSHVTLPVERRFADLPSAQRYVDQVLQLRWVRERWPRAAQPATVRERQGTAAAHYELGSATIALPGVRHGDQWALRETVLLHEIAHHLADDQARPQHGPEYVGRYLELVDGIIGPELALVLRVTFAESGVRWA